MRTEHRETWEECQAAVIRDVDAVWILHQCAMPSIKTRGKEIRRLPPVEAAQSGGGS
jgi:hypothetical protein